MKKPALVLLIAGAMLGAFVAVGAVVGGIWYLGTHGIGSRTPTEAEKKMIITVDRLADYVKLDAKCETLKTSRNIDGTREIEAEYDPKPCLTAEQVSFMSSAEVSRTKREAKQSFLLTVGAYEVGARAGGASLRKVPSLLQLGEDRYSAQMQKNGETVGNVFVVRQGRVVHGLFLAGFALDDRSEIHRLMEPLLQESSRQYGAAR